MSLLLVIGLIVLLVWLFKKSPKQSTLPVNQQLEQRNYDWAQFVVSYYAVANTDQERALVRRMLADIAERGLPVPSLPGEDVASIPVPVPPDSIKTSLAAKSAVQSADFLDEQPDASFIPAQKSVQRSQMDNTSLLLYFGAFLFVASAGLFVGFGGLSGGLRTFLVLLVSVSMYAGGMWLYGSRVALRQAALTFVGIGMTIAPLVGLAAYYYLFDQTSGSLVWFVTSLLCAGMYVHALVRLRQPLIGYIFIFTFLSLFESGISMFSAPLYYFGWAMALVGIGLSFYSRYNNSFLELREPSQTSASILVPLAVIVSLFMLPTLGAGQLGVSLLIAATYYLLEALRTTDNQRIVNAATSQVSGLLGVAALSYAWAHSVSSIALIVGVVGVVQIGILLTRSAISPLWSNFATIALAGQVVMALVSVGEPAALLCSVIALAVFSGLVSWYQSRTDAYLLAQFALITSPLLYAQVFSRPALSIEATLWLVVDVLLTQFVLYLLISQRTKSTEWLGALKLTYTLTSLLPVILSLWASAWWCLGACAAIALSMIFLAQHTRDRQWMVFAGLVSAVPLLLGFDSPFQAVPFLAASLFALVCNVFGALWFRHEANRWFSTILWLLLPVSLGSGALGVAWSASGFAWAYVLVFLGLVLSRAIARGELFKSNKVTLASLARSASVSYVVGYCAAAVVAVALALNSDNPQVHASLIFGVLALATYLLSEFIEKRADLLMLLPIFAQIILLSVWRPANNTAEMIPYLLVSSALAVVAYVVTGGSRAAPAKNQYLRDGSLLMAFVAPMSWLITSHVYWPMPLALLLASALVFDRVRSTTQANRELAGGLVLISVYWYMAFLGVEAIQAYVHVLVALFAGYAYWRYLRGERMQSDQYLWLALATATIPLAIQAMSGAAGGLYGWWLLLEQIAWMLIGMAIGRRFVTMWGLYVAVGAVLYQLRNLGWAALTVLALFLIGLAIYRLQKTDR